MRIKNRNQSNLLTTIEFQFIIRFEYDEFFEALQTFVKYHFYMGNYFVSHLDMTIIALTNRSKIVKSNVDSRNDVC
jgi:hypothetical protein